MKYSNFNFLKELPNGIDGSIAYATIEIKPFLGTAKVVCIFKKSHSEYWKRIDTAEILPYVVTHLQDASKALQLWNEDILANMNKN